MLVKDPLAVLELPEDADRSDLAAGDAGVTRVFRDTDGAFNASRLRPGDVAGHTLDLGVVEAIDHDFVVGTEPTKIRADRTGRPAVGTAEDPPCRSCPPPG